MYGLESCCSVDADASCKGALTVRALALDMAMDN